MTLTPSSSYSREIWQYLRQVNIFIFFLWLLFKIIWIFNTFLMPLVYLHAFFIQMRGFAALLEVLTLIHRFYLSMGKSKGKTSIPPQKLDIHFVKWKFCNNKFFVQTIDIWGECFNRKDTCENQMCCNRLLWRKWYLLWLYMYSKVAYKNKLHWCSGWWL